MLADPLSYGAHPLNRPRTHRQGAKARIEARAKAELGRPFAKLAVSGWELLGDVAVLRFQPRTRLPLRRALARILAEELPARCVVEDLGGIRGKLREPRVRVLYGKGTLTRHLENGLVFTFDVARVMFSSGNQAERARMGALDCRGETVVDLFAGIGYFTVPLAVRAHALRVIACEKNPDAYRSLLENIRLNKASLAVEARLGDCRKVAPTAVADRVVLGYIHGTERFLPTAIRALRPEGGILHFHEAFPQETKFRDALLALARAAGEAYDIEVLDAREVKSFAPGIDHVAVTARLFPRGSRPRRLSKPSSTRAHS